MLINKIIVFITLLFALPLVADECLDRAIQEAIQCRSQEYSRVELKGLIDQLIDYTQPNNIKGSVTTFIREQLKMDVSESQIINLKDTSMSGKSRDLVFFIKDANERVKYVVKAFQDPLSTRSHFLPELSGMTFVKSAFHEVHTAEPLALGKCEYDGFLYALMAETVAPGKRLSDYIYAVGAQPKNSETRLKALQQLKLAMASAGRGFGELARGETFQAAEFPLDKIEKLASRLHDYLLSHASFLYDDRLPRKQLQTEITALLRRAVGMPHYYVYSHGDAHCGNCLYDAETDTFTLIDLGVLHTSIKESGEPQGHVGYDYSRFLEDVQMKSNPHLTPDELRQTLVIFEENYRLVTGVLPSELNQEFFMAYRLLTRLEQYADHVDLADPKKSEERRRIFMYALNRTNHLLQKLKE